MEGGWSASDARCQYEYTFQLHFTRKCVSAFGHPKKGWWPLQEECRAIFCWWNLPGSCLEMSSTRLPEIDNAWSQYCTSFSVKNLINDTHCFLPQNYTLPLLMLKWFSEGSFFFPQAWDEWYHLPGTVSCKKGRLSLELSKSFRGFDKFSLKQGTDLKSPRLA